MSSLTNAAQLQVRDDGGIRKHCHGFMGDSTSVRAFLRLLRDRAHMLILLSRLFTFVLTDGGPALLFWGFIAVASGQLLVYASIAEVASMYGNPTHLEVKSTNIVIRSPTAGGQYHWVSELAPPRIQKLLSYLVGAFNSIHARYHPDEQKL